MGTVVQAHRLNKRKGCSCTVGALYADLARHPGMTVRCAGVLFVYFLFEFVLCVCSEALLEKYPVSGKQPANDTSINSGHKVQRSQTAGVRITVKNVLQHAVIDSRNPDAPSIPGGFEGGNTVKVDGKYHLFAHTYPTTNWSETLIDHWMSPDGLSWRRASSLWASHWNAEHSLWVLPCSPMPFYHNGSWHIYYGLFHQPQKKWTPNGTLWMATSTVAGDNGINGPYDFPGRQLALRPGSNESQPWEGGLLDSVSTPFRTADGQWAVFYGSGPPPHKQNWNVGLATAPSPDGPFVRAPKGNPVPLVTPTGFNENPMPTHDAVLGLYLAPFDFLLSEVTKGRSSTIGVAVSASGLTWDGDAGHAVDLSTGLHGAAPWWRSIRTPHQAIR